MSEGNTGDGPSLPLAALHHIDQVCARFEAAWQANQAPRIEDYLEAVKGAERSRLLRELLLLDLEFRRAHGDTLDPQTYCQRFPDETDLVGAAFAASAPPGPPITPTALDGAGASPPPLTAEPAPGGAVSPDRRIGPYRLLRRLGEGGMGTVFLAEQREPVARQVALKVIRAGLDSAQVIARFAHERQALALMDHPNIARVLDAGATDDGQPYFAMELVSGTPLTEFCDQENLTLRQRLELFVPVCQAVQHAHQKGVIHRDLKPSNVLVTRYDGKPVPKVIDFGLAKAVGPRLTEQSLATGAGTILGTPEYMAPEQADPNSADVDTRADVYALGVILYELLTGTTPLDHRRVRDLSLLKILQRVREEEPVAPSARLHSVAELPAVAARRRLDPEKLTRAVRGELDWIALKALEKDRSRRYATANELVLDLERYLRDEPVLAGPPSRGYRLRKFLKRHKGPVIAATLVLVALVAGMVGTAVGLVRALRAEAQAVVKATEAEAAQQRTREALNTVTDDVIEQLLGKQVQLGDNEKQFLRKVLGFYEEFTRELGETAEARALRASGYYRVGKLRRALGELADAEAASRQALALREHLAADNPAVPQYRYDLAVSHGDLGDLLQELGQWADAERAYRQGITILDELVAGGSAGPVDEYRGSLASSQRGLGVLLAKLGKHAEAEASFRRAVATFQQLAAGRPTVAKYRLQLAHSYGNLGHLMFLKGQGADSERFLRQAAATFQQLANDFPTELEYRRNLATTHNNLGVLLAAVGKTAEADEAFLQGLDIQTKLAADYPAVPRYRDALAQSHHNLGGLLRARGKPAEAEAAARRALAIRERLVADFPAVPEYRRDLADTHGGLGSLLRDVDKRTEAEAAYRQALAVWKRLAADFPTVPEYRLGLASTQVNLGNLLLVDGQASAALEWFDRGIDNVQAARAKDLRKELVRETLQKAYWGRANARNALDLYADAVSDWDQLIDLVPSPQRTAMRVQRARSLARAGDAERATAAADEIARTPAEKGGSVYDAACILSVLSSALADAEQKEHYAGRAIELLTRARDQGFFQEPAKRDLLQKGPDLDPLRSREDFQKLLAP